MFSNNSSSLEISSVANGSTQNFEDNGVEVLHGAGQLAEPALSTRGNEPVAKEGSSVPTKPAPDMRVSSAWSIVPYSQIVFIQFIDFC